jgi:DNA-binding phage protein
VTALDNVSRQSFSVSEFARRNGLSRTFIYKLWKEGRGPAFCQIGAVRRITREQEAAWLRLFEQRSTA